MMLTQASNAKEEEQERDDSSPGEAGRGRERDEELQASRGENPGRLFQAEELLIYVRILSDLRLQGWQKLHAKV